MISPNFLPLAAKYPGKKEKYDLISWSFSGLLQRPPVAALQAVWRSGKLLPILTLIKHKMVSVAGFAIKISWLCKTPGCLTVAWHNRDAGTLKFFMVSSNNHIAQSHPYSCATRLSLFILISDFSLSGIFVCLPCQSSAMTYFFLNSPRILCFWSSSAVSHIVMVWR